MAVPLMDPNAQIAPYMDELEQIASRDISDFKWNDEYRMRLDFFSYWNQLDRNVSWNRWQWQASIATSRQAQDGR